MSSWDDGRDFSRSNKNMSPDTRLSSDRGVAYVPDDSCDEDGGEILLSGGDYWRLDSSIRNERPLSSTGISQRPPLANHYVLPTSSNSAPMMQTMDESGGWGKIQRQETNGQELDEFVMLERQLENMSTMPIMSRPLSQSSQPVRSSINHSSGDYNRSQLSASLQISNRSSQGNMKRPVVSHVQAQNLDHSEDENELEMSLVGHTQYQRERNSGNGSTAYSDEENIDAPIRHIRPVIARPNFSETTTTTNRNVIKGSTVKKGVAPDGDIRSSSVQRISTNGHASSNVADPEEMRRYLTEKAKELEAELITYKQENATLKKLRKEQESLVSAKRTEVHRWAAEERQKTESWCEEQKQAAARERSSAAKVARDNRLALSGTGGAGVRKERAEVEALQATLEKLKIDHDVKERKAKTNERRLQQLVKDNSAHAEDLQQQLLALEQSRHSVFNYLDSIGVRLPGSIVRTLGTIKKGDPGPNTGTSKPANLGFGSTAAPREGSVLLSASKKSVHNIYQKSDPSGRKVVGTYAVEVDPEQLEVGGVDRRSWSSGAGRDRQSYEEDAQQGSLATAIFSKSSTRPLTAPDDSGRGDRDRVLSSTLRRVSESAASRPAVSSSVGSFTSREESTPKSVLGIDHDLKASWARSSRSSRGSRYSDDNDQDSSDDECGVTGDRDRNGVTVTSFADTVRATTAPGTRISNRDLGVTSASSLGNSGSLSSRPPAATYMNYDDSPARMQASGQSMTSREAASPTSEGNVTRTSTTTLNTPKSVAGGSSAGRTEEVLQDGRRLISYRNGTRKELLPNGESLVHFVNGDTKTTGAGNSGVVVYYYAQADTTHTTYKDGVEVYEFPNKQVTAQTCHLNPPNYPIKFHTPLLLILCYRH